MADNVWCYVCRSDRTKPKNRQAGYVVKNAVGMEIALCEKHKHEMQMLDRINGQQSNRYRRLYPGEKFVNQLTPTTGPSAPSSKLWLPGT